MVDAIVHVIDDDDAVRDSLSFLLSSVKIPATTYPSATAFLAALSKDTAGCIVTDIRMPEMTGLELLERLNADGFKLPVIVVTGHADVPLAVEAMKLGASDFLEKPFDEDSLLAAVRAALDRRKHDGERETRAAKARALIAGRYHVSVADIKALAAPVLRHRIITTFYADSEQVTPDTVIARLLEVVPPPKSGL